MDMHTGIDETIRLVIDMVIELYRYHVKRTIVNVRDDAVTLLGTINHYVRIIVKSRCPLEIKKKFN